MAECVQEGSETEMLQV